MINEAQQPRRSLLHQKQHKLRSQPWLLLSSPVRDSATTRTHCKDPKAETLRRTTSQDKCATVLSCLAILYSVNPEEPSQLPSSTRSWLPATITRRSEIQRRRQEKRERAARQTAVCAQPWVGGKPLAQKPVLNSERQAGSRLVLPGAQGSHDKNKPGDKNTARAKRCGHGTGIGAVGG